MNRPTPAPAPVTGRALARGGALLGVAMMVANAGNYALNVGLARWLSAADFGEATLLVTLFLTTTAVGLTLQMVTAREVARLDAGPDPDSADGLQRWLARRAALIGVALATALAVASPLLAGLFRMAHPLPLVVFAAGLRPTWPSRCTGAASRDAWGSVRSPPASWWRRGCGWRFRSPSCESDGG